MALQGDTLAAHVLGIENIIVTNSEEMAKGSLKNKLAILSVEAPGWQGAKA